MRIRQFHNPKLSIWQSAVDEVLVKKLAAQKTSTAPQDPATAGTRPDASHPSVQEAASYCAAIDSGKSLSELTAGPPPAGGVAHTLSYCSVVAMKLAQAILTGNQQNCQRYRDELGKFTDCDPLYAEAAEKYAEYFVAQCKKVPYRVHQTLDDFVIEGKLPPKARVAILGDWGTGQAAARKVLQQIAAKTPDVVIHLGDIYYSGTDFEVETYFYDPWTQILDLPNRGIPTFTLAGNHDMYSGGAAYYNLIDRLGQPASYFCLRNEYWQFLAMDTGLHDSNPTAAGTAATYLEATELEWHQDKINRAGNRRTILLSHHQPFTANDAIDGHEVNLRLYPQVSSFFPHIALWLWGHEHNFVIYEPYMGLERGRCIGHAAFPVGIDEIASQPRFPNVPVKRTDENGKSLMLGATGGLYNHGYVVMDLDGPSAKVYYFQDSDENMPLFQETIP